MKTYRNENHSFSVVRYSNSMLRIRIKPTDAGNIGDSFMERLELLNEPADYIESEVDETNGKISYRWQDMVCDIDVNQMSLNISSKENVKELRCQASLNKKQSSFAIKTAEDEEFFGLGYRKIDSLSLKGKAYKNHVTYGAAYGPQPFLYSSGGYGMYLNTTRDSYFDICSKQQDELLISSLEKEMDLFCFFGSPVEILDQYTALTGRPYLMPKTGYGLMFIGNEKETQFDILNDAERFISEKIPCNYIGLEPGWMDTHYDVTVDKAWNKERFYMPWWSDERKQFQNETFVGALRRKGFGLSLWLCCDYDILWAEQSRLNRDEEIADEIEFEFYETDFDERAHSPIYMDKITKRDEPWFEHLKKFIDDGVSAFKQDPAFLCNDHPDRLYAEQYTDKEIHNIYVTILARQVYEGYKEHTGMRPMHYTGVGYTGIQRFAPSWTCDCGGREEALMGILLSGMCGHMNMTCDLDVTTADGIHFGFLLPWSQINSWASVLQPWYMESKMYEIFCYYARLHDRLLPYLYSYARQGNVSGMPIVRAMPLCYPEDAQSYKANRQYLLGDYLLIGCFDHKIYLPEGKWYDFWTNNEYDGGRWIEASWPDNRGGALFVKEGAILPLKEEETDSITCHLYPGKGSFTLYDDDGITFGYEDGKYVETQVVSEYVNGSCKVRITCGNKGEGSDFGKTRISFLTPLEDMNVIIETEIQEV